jgi:glycosyltransferase involved in cell wall biosynthesis
MTKTLVVMSHDAWYGVPRVLIDVCRFLVKRGWAMKFILFDGGPLLDEFYSLVEVTLLDGPAHCPPCSAGFPLARVIHQCKPALIYVGTTACCAVLKMTSRCGVPIVLHVHELAGATNMYCGGCIDDFIYIPTYYIAASQAVQAHLTDKYHIPADKIVLAYEGVDISRVTELARCPSPGITLRANPEEFVIGAAGACTWRKGADLWLKMALQVRRRSSTSNMRFVWIGFDPELEATEPCIGTISGFIDECELKSRIRFLPYFENYYPILNQFDILTLTSREDPCPLVVLDSLYLQKPVLCFAEAGGTPEVIRSDAGIAVPNCDVGRMADAVMWLLRNPHRRIEMGMIGKRRIEQEFRIEILGKILEGVFASLA